MGDWNEDKFLEDAVNIQGETESLLRLAYPNSRIKVKLFSHKRDLDEQNELVQSGASKSSISLHNFGAAVDYQIFIDGKYQQAKTEKTLRPYKILGGVAKKYNMFWGWDFDSGHIATHRFVSDFLLDHPKEANKESVKDWYTMNADTTKLSYKPTMNVLDSLYNKSDSSRVYLGKPRTIDPLLVPINESNKEVFKYIK